MPGADAPIASRAKKQKHANKSTTGSPVSLRHSLRNGFNGFFRALSGDRAFLPPMPASRHQDHTASPSAFEPLVWRHQRVHRILHPNFRDDRDTPLYRGIRTREKEPLICPSAQEGFFHAKTGPLFV